MTVNAFVELLAYERAVSRQRGSSQLELLVSEMKLYIDDVRSCPEGWVAARTAEEAIRELRHNNVEEISFDHDLGPGMTGYDVACEIERIVAVGGGFPRFPKWKIHSSNPVGRKNIERAMKAAERMSR